MERNSTSIDINVNKAYNTNEQDVGLVDIGDYTYQVLTRKDYSEAIELVGKQFEHRDVASILFGCEAEHIMHELTSQEKFCDSGLSVICRDRATQELVGVLIGHDFNFEDVLPFDSHSVGMQDYFQVFDQLHEELYENGTLTKEHGRFNTQYEVAVAKDHAGRKIGVTLIRFQEHVAHLLGYKDQYMIAWASVAANIVEKAGYKSIKEHNFDMITLPSTQQKLDFSRLGDDADTLKDDKVRIYAKTIQPMEF